MIITCPKFSYYSALSNEVKSTVRSKIKEVVTEYVIGKPIVMLEDTLAVGLLREICDVVSVTDERDFSQMVAMNYYEAESNMPGFYSMYPHEICPFVKFENPSMSLMAKDREQYQIKRVEAYEKRLSESARWMAEKHKAVLTFTGNMNSKGRLEVKPKDNDGILNIMFNLDTDVINCYYSGVWVEIEMAKQILGGLYA